MGRFDYPYFEYFQVTSEELDVEKGLKNCGVDVKTFWGHTLYHKSDLPYDVKK